LADIFISYARNDRGQVERLAAALQALGYSVWWDRQLVGGDEFSDAIERELDAARAIIVGWSATGSKSRWVKDEASIAADASKMIAISLDGFDPPIGFRQFHCIDLSGWRGLANEAAFVELARAVDKRLSSTPAPMAPSAHAFGSHTGLKPDAAPALSAKSDNKIIAVLPFVNRSPKPDDAFFADGVHDELLTQLSKLSAIQVISRTSVMRFRDTQKPIPEIAKELGAAVILEGAVQRAGARVRINVQLIDAITDIHLWAENFDRALTPENLFDIQGEITREIATAMEAALSQADEAALDDDAPTQSQPAYDAYLRGKLLARSEATGGEDFRAAIKAFDEAIGEDATFGEPHAAKARAQLTLYWFYGWDAALVDEARAAVDRAQKLAPANIETLLAEAYYHYWGKLDYPRAEAALNRVLDRAPNNADAWACKAYVIRRAGRFGEAILALERALKLNPLLIDIPLELALTYCYVGRFSNAYESMERARMINPRMVFSALHEGDVQYYAGAADLAWKGAKQAVDDPDFVYYYRRTFHALNNNDADEINAALDEWPEEFYGDAAFPETFPLYKAMALHQRGARVEAQKLLGKIKARMGSAGDHINERWAPDAPYFPVTLPGLMGDGDGVRAAVAAFEENAPTDEAAKINHYHAIASGLAQVGDNAAALGFLERLQKLFGPQAFLAMSITPAYDGLKDEARYRAMKKACEDWAARQVKTGSSKPAALSPPTQAQSESATATKAAAAVGLGGFLAELRRRKVFRVAGVYAAVSWIVMQVVSVMASPLGMPAWVESFFAVLLLTGFPIALTLAWAFELTPEGVKLKGALHSAAPKLHNNAAKKISKIDVATIAALVVVCAIIAWQLSDGFALGG